MTQPPFPLPRAVGMDSQSENRDLFRLWRIPFNNETDPSKLMGALRERIKELNCLYGIARLAELHPDSVDDLLRDLVKVLPYSWQYPEIACARIVFKGETYKSSGFEMTRWRQSAQIYMYNEPVGEVAIFYLEECQPADEGPFLHEERALLDALAERIGSTAMRISAEVELLETNQQLMLERKALKDANSALRAVLSRIEEEKQGIYRDVKTNIDKVIIPLLHALAMDLPQSKWKYIEVLKTNLDEIVSPFVNNLSRHSLSLTPTEVNICNLIRNGLQTKEIARMRGVSAATIKRHREHIRRKLKISNSKINLATYLQSDLPKGV